MSTGSSTGRNIIPDALLLSALDCTTQGGLLDLSKIPELSSIELIFHLHRNLFIPITSLAGEMPSRDVALPSTISLEELSEMSSKQLQGADRNVIEARKRLVDCLSQYQLACPQVDQLLFQWRVKTMIFNSGAKTEACNFQPSNSGNGSMSLTLVGAYILCHIMFDSGLPLVQLVNLWAQCSSTFSICIRKRRRQTKEKQADGHKGGLVGLVWILS
jgi:hypothetical protein